MLHVSNGAGTFFYYQALANCEAALAAEPCKYQAGNLHGDKPPYPPRRRDCKFRIAEAQKAGLGFVGFERGLLDGEFCPDEFDYVLLMRHPIDLMDSMASTPHHAARANASVVMSALQRAELDVPGYRDYLKAGANAYKHRVGWGMSFFDNPYTRFLAASSETMFKPLGAINATDFAAATRTLARFALVLSTELLKTDRQAAERLLAGPPLHWTHGLFPVARNHHATHLLTGEQRDALTQRNMWDMKLWAALRDREQQRPGESRLRLHAFGAQDGADSGGAEAASPLRP